MPFTVSAIRYKDTFRITEKFETIEDAKLAFIDRWVAGEVDHFAIHDDSSRDENLPCFTNQELTKGQKDRRKRRIMEDENPDLDELAMDIVNCGRLEYSRKIIRDWLKANGYKKGR